MYQWQFLSASGWNTCIVRGESARIVNHLRRSFARARGQKLPEEFTFVNIPARRTRWSRVWFVAGSTGSLPGSVVFKCEILTVSPSSWPLWCGSLSFGVFLFVFWEQQVFLCLVMGGGGFCKPPWDLGPQYLGILTLFRILTSETERTLDSPRQRRHQDKSSWSSTWTK